MSIKGSVKSKLKLDYKTLNENVRLFDWTPIHLTSDVQLGFETLIENLNTLITTSRRKSGVKNKSPHSFKRPWMTNGLFDLTRKRTKLHNQLKKQPFNETLKIRYKS